MSARALVLAMAGFMLRPADYPEPDVCTPSFNKKQPLWLFIITKSANEHQFSKFFQRHIPNETPHVSVIETSTSSYLCCYITL